MIINKKEYIKYTIELEEFCKKFFINVIKDTKIDINLISLYYISRATELSNSIRIIARRDLANSGIILNRCQFENMLEYKYLCKNPENNLKKFIDYFTERKPILYKASILVNKLHITGEEVEPTLLKDARTNLRALKNKEGINEFEWWKSNKIKSIEDLAKEVDEYDNYLYTHFLANLYVHGNPSILRDFLKIKNDKIVIQFNNNEIDGEVVLNTNLVFYSAIVRAFCSQIGIKGPSFIY